MHQMLRWEEQFGYTPDQGERSLARLRDGFRFNIAAGGGHVLELLRVDIAWKKEPEWVRGLLGIAQEYSHWQLALGLRFFALLVMPERSEIIGAKIGDTKIPGVFRDLNARYNNFEVDVPHQS